MWLENRNSRVYFGIILGVLLIAAIGITHALHKNKITLSHPSIPLYTGKPGTKILDTCINPKDGAEMVWVPAGKFLMGISKKDAQLVIINNPGIPLYSIQDEQPKRSIYLSGYWVYKYPVSTNQYMKFCKATGRKFPDMTAVTYFRILNYTIPIRYSAFQDNYPMTYVNWQQSVDYAAWAGASLPTEAQYEKAARGTDGRTYPWGNKWDSSKCVNSVGKQLQSTESLSGYESGKSPYGCMQMVGNIYEWCGDYYDLNYYKKAPLTDPPGPAQGTRIQIASYDFRDARILRGGSWVHNGSNDFRCTDRHLWFPDQVNSEYGFRCVIRP